jgi:hypothetical protein
MYSPIMAPIIKITEIGRGSKPKRTAKGVNGKLTVTTPISMVAASRYFPGLLLKKGFQNLSGNKR